MTNTVARAIEQVCFAVEETTKGTVKHPTAAAEMIISAGVANINQQPAFTDSEEINNSLDVLERFQNQVGAGQWSLPIYIRPSGTAGTAPMGKILFESLMGLETIVTDTSVTYAQALTKPSFTLWMKKGHTVFFGSGACAESAALNFVNNGAAKVEFSGGFMRLGWAGTDAANGATADGTGTGYLVDLVAGYEAGDTTIHVDSGTGTILEGDVINFEDDATDYFVETGFVGDGDGDIVLRAPGLTAALADGKTVTIAGNSKITVDDGKKFTADALVQIGDDTNTNAGYAIVSVDGNNLFFGEAVTCADDAVVKGFLPTGLTCVGAPLENKKLTITFDGTSKNIKSLGVNINSPVEWQDQEITTSGYVTEYIENKRAITCSLNVLFRESDLSYFYDAVQNTKVAVIGVLSDGAGKICTVNLPYTELEVPNIQTSAPAIDLTIAGVALGSSGEDSCSIAFT